MSASPAAAVVPAPRTVYAGTAAGNRITVKVTARHAVTVTLRCHGRRIVLKNLPLTGGRFSGDRNDADARRNPVAHVEGRFVTAQRAQGRYTARKCAPRRGRWTARRQ